MAAKKLTKAEWEEYLAQFNVVCERLEAQAWFAEGGWQTVGDLLGDKENPRGVWMGLIKPHWFNGNLHIETWLNQSVLEAKALPVVLHVETSEARDGVNRNRFSKLFLERAQATVEGWDGWTVKPTYAQEPISTRAPFTKETLPEVLERELTHLQTLGAIIDQTIDDTRSK
jgi:hypothetical protein